MFSNLLVTFKICILSNTIFEFFIINPILAFFDVLLELPLIIVFSNFILQFSNSNIEFVIYDSDS